MTKGPRHVRSREGETTDGPASEATGPSEEGQGVPPQVSSKVSEAITDWASRQSFGSPASERVALST